MTKIQYVFQLKCQFLKIRNGGQWRTSPFIMYEKCNFYSYNDYIEFGGGGKHLLKGSMNSGNELVKTHTAPLKNMQYFWQFTSECILLNHMFSLVFSTQINL